MLHTYVQHLAAGTVGGLVATVFLYPLDLIKVRYQVANVGSAYSSVVSALTNILRTEGFIALYQVCASFSWVFGVSVSEMLMIVVLLHVAFRE